MKNSNADLASFQAVSVAVADPESFGLTPQPMRRRAMPLTRSPLTAEPVESLLGRISTLQGTGRHAPGRPQRTSPLAEGVEIVGEFWGLDTDRALFRHFRRYHAAEFPALAHVNRTTFARQAANLWRVKQLLQRAARRAAGRRRPGSGWSTACRSRPASSPAPPSAAASPGVADYGYDHLVKRTFYGFRLHLRTSRDGVILAYELAPARAGGPGGAAGAGPAAGQRRHRRPGLLGPGVARPAGGARGASSWPRTSTRARTRTGRGRRGWRGAVPDRDGQRPVGGAVRDQADVGAGPVAPVPPAHPQGPQPHGDDLADRQRTASRRCPSTGSGRPPETCTSRWPIKIASTARPGLGLWTRSSDGRCRAGRRRRSWTRPGDAGCTVRRESSAADPYTWRKAGRRRACEGRRARIDPRPEVMLTRSLLFESPARLCS